MHKWKRGENIFHPDSLMANVWVTLLTISFSCQMTKATCMLLWILNIWEEKEKKTSRKEEKREWVKKKKEEKELRIKHQLNGSPQIQ